MSIGAVQPGYTFGDLMLLVAKEFGYARIVDDAGNDTTPQLPSEPSRVDALAYVVAGGYESFLRANPKWSFLTPTHTITMDSTGTGALNVAGDAGRYLLPVGVSGRPSDGWLLTLPSVDRRAYTVSDTSAKRVAADRAANTSVGMPGLAAVRPMMQDDGSLRWEVFVSPLPDRNYTLTAQLRLAPPRMSALDDRHIAGPAHDDTIAAMAFAAMAMREGDSNKISIYRDDAQSALDESIRLDGLMIEHDIGVLPSTWSDERDRTRADDRRGGFPLVNYNGAIP